MLDRRKLLQYFAAGACVATAPRLAMAKADTDARLVLVILRGAADGLAMAAPYGDGNYDGLRGELALAKPGSEGGVLKIDGIFGLHPSFRGVHSLFEERQAILLHAIATPYRERSHFDGQDMLELGASPGNLLRDGWLNRTLRPLGSSVGDELAIALSQNTPLVLRGTNSVTSWAPSRLPDADDDTLSRLEDLYADDEFFATRLAQAMESQAIAGNMGNLRRRGNDAEQLKAALQSTARFLAVENGLRIAVVESGGWDTHANQGAATGNLANRFAALDEALSGLRDGLGSYWSNTAVLVVTEFGRTARVNGTRGTDHGTATAALLLGGAVSGGRIVADWLGLANRDLYAGRDLYPTTDMRSLFKGVLIEHLGLDDAFVERDVFPESGNAKPLTGLIRTM
ncbi:MAG: DUF1501 domain-containing protein [Gammaproteobacteria bacterium]|nr:DUF1501 domain-containing protein [Gammaproteobacteria bacterium]